MIKVGDYVWYLPYEGCSEYEYQLGRVKGMSDNENYVFVVYSCNKE